MKTERLHPLQVMTTTVGAVFGVDILLAPNKMVSVARQDRWISLTLGGLPVLIIGSMNYYLASLYPDKDLPQIFLHVAGKFWGRILMFPFTVYMILYIALSMRIFAQALKMFLLDRTPISVIVFVMALVAAYAVYHGIYTIGEVVDIIFPICLFTIFSIILLSLQQVNTSYLEPILFENTGNVIKGILPGFRQFTGYGVTPYIYCYVQKSKGVYKWYLTGLIITIVAYVALTLVSIMVFSYQSVSHTIYPTLSLTKSIEFPATFLERLEAFAAILWIGIVFMSVILYFFATDRDISTFFGIKEKYQKFVVWGLIPLLVAGALVIRSGLKIMQVYETVKVLETSIAMVVFPIFTFFARLKKKKEAKG
ncbi:MAG: GerAB/ArcD/ProY family transporter [Clostridia bacterium]|jgi:spore germination protein